MGVHARRKQLKRKAPPRPGRTSTTTPEGIVANDPEAAGFAGEGRAGRPPATNGKHKARPEPVLQGWQQSACGPVVTLYVADCDRHPDNREPTEEQILAIADSYEKFGQLDPIVVWEHKPRRYQILSGETRWLAAQVRGWDTIQARVAQLIDEATALQYLARFNGERSDLDPIQRAKLGRRLCQPQSEGGGGVKRDQAAQAVGLESPAALTNLMALLDLPEEWQDRVASGELAPSWAQRIVPVRHAAPVMESLDLDWANRDTARDTGTFQSRQRLEDAIKCLLDTKLREVNDRQWLDSLSARDREKLGLFDMLVADGRGKQREAVFATNVLLVDELAARSGGPKTRPPKSEPPRAQPQETATAPGEAGHVAARNGAPPPKSAAHDRSFEPPETAARSASPADKIEHLTRACELVISWLSNRNICSPQAVLDRVREAMIDAGYPAHALERVTLDGAASIGRATISANGHAKPKAAKKKGARA